MKLTIDTLEFTDFHGIDEGLRLIKEAGFDGVDVSLYPYGGTLNRCFLYDDDYMKVAEQYRDSLEKYRLIHEQSHAPFTFKYGMAEDVSCDEYKIMLRAFEAAALIGCSFTVIHGLKLPDGSTPEENVDYNTAFYQRFEPYAEKYGIKIGVENISCSCTTPEMHMEVMSRLDPEHYICLMDVGHSLVRAKLQPADYLRKLPHGMVKALHVQDTTFDGDLHHLPGIHKIDFPEFLKALKEHGYEGNFSLEIPKFCRPYVRMGLAEQTLALAHAVGRKLVGEYEAL